MPKYPNGQIPEHELYIFNRGRTVHKRPDGTTLIEDWYQGLTPGTYQKHVALVALARKNTSRTLQVSAGFSCYRPLYGQTIARILHGNGAARVGTSSHGGWWENRDTMAMDYHNWAYVYDGNRDRFYADCRAVGLAPGMISKDRGYPDEPWHVIDFDPWRAVTAGGGSRPFDPNNPATAPKEWDEMATQEEVKQSLREVLAERTSSPLNGCSLIPTPDGSIFLFSWNTGARVGVQNTEHARLIQRASKNNSHDTMLGIEIDIVAGYVAAVNPPPLAKVDTEALAEALGQISLDGDIDEATVSAAVDAAIKANTTYIANATVDEFRDRLSE